MDQSELCWEGVNFWRFQLKTFCAMQAIYFYFVLKFFKMIEYFTDILKDLLFLYFIVNLTNIVLEKWKS